MDFRILFRTNFHVPNLDDFIGLYFPAIPGTRIGKRILHLHFFVSMNSSVALTVKTDWAT